MAVVEQYCRMWLWLLWSFIAIMMTGTGQNGEETRGR
jgi:hypothetical protein